MPPRFHLNQHQWKKIAPELPSKKTDPGYTAHDNRLDFEAMITYAREGHTCRGLDQTFGKRASICQRMDRWEQQGVFHRLFETFIAKRGVGSLIVDGTFIKVHQDGTGARKAYGGPESQAIGETKGGRNTKIIAACDENGDVFTLLVVPGNRNESPYTLQLIEGITAENFIADRAYDDDKLLTGHRGTRNRGGGPATEKSPRATRIRRREVQNQEPDRARLPKNETVPRHRHTIQKNRPDVRRSDHPDPGVPHHQAGKKRAPFRPYLA